MADTAGGLTHEVLGRNQNNVPDFLRIQYGKGQLLVMTNCEGLGNYFLLTRDNNRYALGALSYLPTSPAQVYWDDFYFSHTVRPPEESRNSILHVIFSIPYLFWAFWILILLLALWVITNFFRKQRLLPVRKPNTNSSMEFTKTIARLYFNKKDNRNIALKMIAYFQDHLRGKYYMNFTGFNEEFGRILAAKTGLDPARAEQLVNTIQTVQHNATTTDETLLALNEQIQEVLRK